MADNQAMNGTTALIATDEVTYSGDVASVQLMRLVDVTGAEGSKTVTVPTHQQRLMAYNYPISTNNSSTGQLAAGATFTGVIETAQDQPSISILLTSDQTTTIRLRQFIDAGGSFAAPDIFFYVNAGEGFARSVTINGNFVQVIAQNTGASTTTTFNLNVAFGNLGDADSSGVQPITELPLVLTGAALQTAVVNNILNPTAGVNGINVSGFRAASVQILSTGTGGTFIFEQSNIGGVTATDWLPLPVFNASLVTAVPITGSITATASSIVYTIPLRCNFLRCRIVTTITGGSIRAFSRISTEPWTPTVNLVASNTAANNQAQVSGTVSINAVPAGTNLIGDIAGQPRAGAGGFALPSRLASAAASTNGTVVKGSAGRVYKITGYNNTATIRYLKLHNSATVTVGTTPVVNTYALKPNDYFNIDFGLIGQVHATGICYSLTTGVADADTGALTAGDIVGLNVWFA